MARKRRPIGSGHKPPSTPRRNQPGRKQRAVVLPKRRRSAAKPAPQARPLVDFSAQPAMRVGHGWDLHRLDALAPGGQGRPMVLGGVRIDDSGGMGPVSHSDGDVLYHAVTDAILGSLGLPDIGTLFSDKDPENEGRNSAEFLVAAVRKLIDAGYSVSNLDCTVVCERPRIGPVKEQIRLNLARLLEVSPDRVNVKGKTHERVDAVGEGRAVEAHAVVLVALRPKGK